MITDRIDPQLEARLRSALKLDPARVARIRDGIARRASATPSASRWRPAIAAAVVIGLALGASLWSGRAPTGGSIATGVEPIILSIRSTEPTPGEGNFDARRIGILAPRSDFVVTGEVIEVLTDEVRFRIDDVLAGRRERLVGLSVRRDAGWHSGCEGPLHWTAGERAFLFLHRDPKAGALRVTHAGAGKNPIPMPGGLDVATMRRVLADGRVTPPVTLDVLKRRGARGLGQLVYQCAGRYPVDASTPEAEARLVEALGTLAAREHQAWAACLPLLSPTSVRDLLLRHDDARRRMDEAVARRRAWESHRVAILGALLRAGDAPARAALEGLAAKTTVAATVLDLLALRVETLETRLRARASTPDAPAWLVATLVAGSDPASSALVLDRIDRDGFSMEESGWTLVRALTRATAAARAATAQRAVTQLETASRPNEILGWWHVLATTGLDDAASRRAIAPHLRRELPTEQRRALVEYAERIADHEVLDWVRPTDAEVSAAARALEARLRR